MFPLNLAWYMKQGNNKEDTHLGTRTTYSVTDPCNKTIVFKIFMDVVLPQQAKKKYLGVWTVSIYSFDVLLSSGTHYERVVMPKSQVLVMYNLFAFLHTPFTSLHALLSSSEAHYCYEISAALFLMDTEFFSGLE